MARNRRPGEAPVVPTRGPTETPLALLLHARRFRVAAGGERVAANVIAGGAQVSADAPAWVGLSAPPLDTPTLSLGPNPGSLGPHSYGFLNNARGGLGAVVALDLPPPAQLPRAGRLGIIVPRRDALPDLIPLLCARDLPISWLVSVGDGDPGEALAFLSQDANTDAIAIVLGEGAKPAGLRAAIGAKPTVVLGGDALCRAVARRAGSHVVDRIGEWLALGALLGAGATLEDPVEIWIIGGGVAWLRGELGRYAVDVPVQLLDERDPNAILDAIGRAVAPRLAIVIGAGVTLPAAVAPASGQDQLDRVRLVVADTSQPEQVSRLLKALGAELARRSVRTEDGGTDSLAAPSGPADPELAARVRAETDGTLSDHDAKRLFKAWGLKVSRQGPTGTPTGAVKLARLIGIPAVLVRGDDERVADSVPEVRRLAALMLETPGDDARSVMVRERYAESPRCKVRIAQERGVGSTIKVTDASKLGDAIAILPIEGAEALRLAKQGGARRASDQQQVAAVLIQLGVLALAEHASFDIELFIANEPVVVRATGTLRKTT